MTESTHKTAYLAYDVQPWGPTTGEPEVIGVSFAHKDSRGFDIVLDGLPLSGKILLRPSGAATTGVSTILGGLPAKRPDYLAYLVSEKKDRDGKSRWRKIGFGFRHADGEGIDVLYKTVPINGRISLRVNDAQ